MTTKRIKSKLLKLARRTYSSILGMGTTGLVSSINGSHDMDTIGFCRTIAKRDFAVAVHDEEVIRCVARSTDLTISASIALA